MSFIIPQVLFAHLRDQVIAVFGFHMNVINTVWKITFSLGDFPETTTDTTNSTEVSVYASNNTDKFLISTPAIKSAGA